MVAKRSLENTKNKMGVFRGIAIVISFCLVGVGGLLPAQSQPETSWNALTHKLDERAAELVALIKQAEGKGLSTDYAEVSRQVIATFQLAARHDHEHHDEVRRIFGTFRWKQKVDTGAAADRLATDELTACLQVADYAIGELQNQLAGKLTLGAVPDLAKGRMTLGAGSYLLEGRPVFPSSLTWLPDEEGLLNAFGRMGGAAYQLTNLKADGKADVGASKRSVTAIRAQTQLNAAPFVFHLGHATADWMKKAHPEVLLGARRFTQYDIDSPYIRGWLNDLCGDVLPTLSRGSGDQPVIHLLANEPHFATVRGGWLAGNGVSDLTIQKYRHWLAAKYQGIGSLNQVYTSAYKDFAEVKVGMPIDSALRGGPVWYDWCRFNMDRVNDWFTFLKTTTQAADPKHSPVSIKTLGHTLGNPDRDHGMDIEYLTKLQDIPGSDLRVVPQGATFYGKNEDGRETETGWGYRYAYLWVDQSMVLDFTKSLCPDKVFFDSEWHGFGTVSWRHYQLNREYVRSAIWLAFTHGMGAIKPWLWGRDINGALSPKTEHIGELSTQPIALDAYGRVMKELNAHALQVVSAVPTERRFMIYYCEESAIQSGQYMEQVRQVYEALKLLNLPVGFTTADEIGRLTVGTQTVIMPPTPFISNVALGNVRSFQGAGGRVVFVDAERSFVKTEVGMVRTDGAILTSFASLPFQDVLPLAQAFDAALTRIKPMMPVDVLITDNHGQKAYGVIISQSVDQKTGQLTLVANNVSKDPRVITLTPRDKRHENYIDELTKQSVSPRFVMAPCEVRMLVNKR